MQSNKLRLLFISIFVLIARIAPAQVYRASVTDALQNNGMEWVEKKLPPSLITFSDYSGEIEIKTALFSLFTPYQHSTTIIQNPADTLAVFTMKLDKELIKQQQNTTGKTFTTTGLLTINDISRKITAQCQLVPGIDAANGFNISVMIRFNPADFGMGMTGETEHDPLIVRVRGGYINRLQTNFK